MSQPSSTRWTNTRLAVVLIGSHVHQDDPLAAAQADGADVVQFFLGNPQSWKKPKPRDDAATLKASSVPLYVHAPYLINVASANNRIRIPSRKILQDTCDAAADISATAVIVHGGHADFGTGQIDPEVLVAVVEAADGPVICETADEGRKDDIAFLRERTHG